MVATSCTFIEPLNLQLTSCLLCLNVWANFSGRRQFPFAISYTLIEPLSLGLYSWCLNFIQPFPRFCESQSYKNKLHLQFLQNKYKHLTSKSISPRSISGNYFFPSFKLIIILFEISSPLEGVGVCQII